MKMIVIGTRYCTFSAINSLTEACASSSEVLLRAIFPLPHVLSSNPRPSRLRIDHVMHGSAGRPALQRVSKSLRVMRKAGLTSLRAASEVTKWIITMVDIVFSDYGDLD